MLSIELIVLAEGAMFIPAMRRSLLALALAFAGASQAAITTSFNNGTLTITSDGADSIDPGCNAGNIALTGTAIAPAVACNAVQQLIVQGGPDANTISLVGVLATDFTALTTITVAGGDGNDTITGTLLADTLSGGNGDDTLIGDDSQLGTADVIAGDDGDDTMIWNPGDDDDINEGGAGNDTAVVNGGNGNAPAETFTIAPAPFNTGRVDFNRTNPAPFFIDIAATERLQVNANGGDDVITGATGLVGLIALELNGGDGNDTITGGDGADLIRGGNNNDTIDGSDNPVATVDQVFGDDGDDTMIWNPGKDDDLNDGGPGTDTSVVNGGGAAETFTIAPDPVNAGRVDFNRTNPAPFFIDIAATERLQVNANGGDDVITGSTGLVGLIALELNGGDGNDTITGGDGADLIRGGNNNDTIDGSDNPVATVDQVFGDDGDDTMIWNPGKDDDLNDGGPGTDTSVVNGGGAAETFTIAPDPVNAGRVDFNRTNPAPFFIDIAATERLQVNANGGDDVITGAAGLVTLLALELNGGDGNDTITGGDGADLIRGGNNNDTLIGDDNPATTLDQVFGDDGDDSMTWNPGDDDDLNEGGAGNDTVVVNGGSGAEAFRIAANGARVRFDRTNNAPAPFFLDIGSSESLQLNAAGGADTVTTVPLTGFAQQLDGGDPTTSPGDTLIVVGFTGDASISPIAVPGFGPITHAGFEFDAVAGATRSFTASLDGAQEVPPVDTTGTGRGTVVLNAARDQITVRLSFSGLGGNNTLTHIHGPAAPGANAAPIFDLGNTNATSGTLGPFTFAVTPQQAAELEAGLWYFNVHSTTDQNGEIRGQILADRIFEAFLSGAQEVPPTPSTATGFGTVTLAGPEDQIVVALNYIGLSGNNTLTHIHAAAPRGQNAAPLIDLRVSGATADSFTTNPIAVTPAQVADLKAGRWYFNVHSTVNGGGEIRGQIDNAQLLDGFE